jgi:hypothetical protein
MEQIDETIKKINKLKNNIQLDSVEDVLNNYKKVSENFYEGFDPSDIISKFLKKMTDIGKGLEKIFTGIFVKGFDGLGKGLNVGFNNIGEFLFWTSEFLFSYLSCGIQYIENIHRCIFYYSVDALAKLFYFPITFILWLSWEVGGTDLYKTHDKIWDTIYSIDSKFYDTFGFHFAHYSKNITNMCYNCKRLRVVALKSKSSQINYDFETKLPELLQAGLKDIMDGAKIMS